MKIKKAAAILTILSMLPASSAFAAEKTDDTKALLLNRLGLMDGVSKESFNPGFDMMLTREEAAAMVVRFMGKSQDAVNENNECPFPDVSDWAKPYIGYAYKNGIAAGESSEWFGGKKYVTMQQLCTFYLRAMGYEKSGDLYDTALQTAITLEMTDSEDNPLLTRRDMVNVTYAALYAHPYGSSAAMVRELADSNAIPYAALVSSGDDGLIAAYNRAEASGSGSTNILGDLENAAKLTFGNNAQNQKAKVVSSDKCDEQDYFGERAMHIPVGGSLGIDIDDEYITPEDKYFTIIVSYFDSGADKIRVSYSDRVRNYRESYIYKTNTNTWKTAALVISDAALNNMQNNGADITVWAENESGAGVDEYISSVTVVKQTKEEQPVDESKIEPVIYNAYINFKKKNEAQCFTQKTSTKPDWYGYTQAETKADKECISIGVDKRCVLSLDDDFIMPDENECTIRITYYDNGTSRFKFAYSTETERYKNVFINRTGTNEWKTFELKVSDASFMNRQDESMDISIYGVKADESTGGDETVYISSFEIEKPKKN